LKRLVQYGLNIDSFLFFSFFFTRLQIVTGAALQLLGAWLRYFSTFVQNQQGKFALAMIGQVRATKVALAGER
jgi:hypothetical protein